MAKREIDCLSEVCPVPILKAMKEMKTMDDGDVVVLHSDHSCVGINVQEWAEKKQYPIEIEEVNDTEWKIHITKTDNNTAQVNNNVNRSSMSDKKEETDKMKNKTNILKKPWPYWVGGILLGVLNVVLLAICNINWQITSGFLLWSAGILKLVGIDILSWEYFSHFDYYYGDILINKNLFLNKYTILNVAVIIGSLLATLLASNFKIKKIRSKKQMIAALVGGIMMGYGTRMAIGCNIGAFFSGIPSFSLHAYVFGICCFIGAWVGCKAIAKFIF